MKITPLVSLIVLSIQTFLFLVRGQTPNGTEVCIGDPSDTTLTYRFLTYSDAIKDNYTTDNKTYRILLEVTNNQDKDINLAVSEREVLARFLFSSGNYTIIPTNRSPDDSPAEESGTFNIFHYGMLCPAHAKQIIDFDLSKRVTIPPNTHEVSIGFRWMKHDFVLNYIDGKLTSIEKGSDSFTAPGTPRPSPTVSPTPTLLPQATLPQKEYHADSIETPKGYSPFSAELSAACPANLENQFQNELKARGGAKIPLCVLMTNNSDKKAGLLFGTHHYLISDVFAGSGYTVTPAAHQFNPSTDLKAYAFEPHETKPFFVDLSCLLTNSSPRVSVELKIIRGSSYQIVVDNDRVVSCNKIP